MKFVSTIARLFIRPAPRVLVIPAAVATPIDVRARLEIRDWLALPTTQRVLALMEARHPGTQTARIGKVARSEWDQLAAVNYLNRIAGWEGYRNALMTLAETPISASPVSESYPDQV
jgi:hypothetical protein